MSRARNIKPGFFMNERLAECDPLARILFAGLWCEADRSGILEDRPKRIKANCLPYDECDCHALLEQLRERGFIARYQVANVSYIQILAFNKHQNPHIREAASTLPSYAEHCASTVLADICTGSAPLIPDSGFLIPDSLIPEKKQKHEQQAARFDEFWSEYPNRKGKADALAKWKLRNLDAIADVILEDVRRRKAQDRDWLRGYPPHASTYVNGKGWEDDIPEVKSESQQQPRKLSAVEQVEQAIRDRRDAGQALAAHGQPIRALLD